MRKLKNTENQNYSAYLIIKKKRDGEVLESSEIKWFIQGIIDQIIDDSQASAMLMAIYLNGMNTAETAALTDSMLNSGKILEFNDPLVVDKHSTGGVGDKTSFILAPIAAACGVKVAMIAGRGLGHTGGTVDKIESIKGFKTNLKLTKFVQYVNEKNLCLIGQTKEIAPADKKLYALRDTTATIESIPLITASIMSKKLAEGASSIVMDIKTGKGAFMEKMSSAKKLAKSLRGTAQRFDKNMMTIISNMDQPLGNAVGNSLEIIESVETLKGKGPKDLADLSLELAGGMIYLAGLAKSHQAGISKAKKALKSGLALKKFREFIKYQEGDPSFIDNYDLLPQAKMKIDVLSPKSGYITAIDGKAIGQHCVTLGGGRKVINDKIDFGVGLYFHKKIAAKVTKGTVLATIHYNQSQQQIAKEMVATIASKNITIKSSKPLKQKPLIFETQICWAKDKLI